MIVAGIDPGKSGAIFLYDGVAGLHACEGIPLIEAGPKGKTQPDYLAWWNVWEQLVWQADHVFIERVGAMPGQGVTSMFNFGYVVGLAYGLVLAARKPHTFITPQSWKKAVGLSGSDGEQSRKRASQLMPSSATFWPLKKHDGRAEAALIAYVGYQILTGVQSGNSLSDGCGNHSGPAGGEGNRKPAKGRRKTRT